MRLATLHLLWPTNLQLLWWDPLICTCCDETCQFAPVVTRHANLHLLWWDIAYLGSSHSFAMPYLRDFPWPLTCVKLPVTEWACYIAITRQSTGNELSGWAINNSKKLGTNCADRYFGIPDSWYYLTVSGFIIQPDRVLLTWRISDFSMFFFFSELVN